MISATRTVSRLHRRVWLLLSLLPVLLTACAVAPSLVGFPEREIASERDEVKMLLGDIGQSGSSHGFHLATVDPSRTPPDDVAIEWVEIS